MGRDLRFYVFGGCAYLLVLEALLVGAILFWPEFEPNIETLRGMVPMTSVQEIFDQISEYGVSAYVFGQHFFKGCNTVGMLAAVVFAMGAVAGEANRGTLELWLSRPVSRRRLLLERWVGGALATVVPVFATSLSVPLLLRLVHEEMGVAELLLASVQQSLLLLAAYSLTFLWSCVASRIVPIAFGMLMFTVFQFALWLIPKVTHWSLFRLTDIETFARIGGEGSLDWRSWLPLVGASAVFLLLSLFAFGRRVP
jgi:ABC-2 type transport system permease protein